MRWMLVLVAACASSHEEKPAAAPELARAEPPPATKAAGDPDEGGQLAQPQAAPTAVATSDQGQPAQGARVDDQLAGAAGGGIAGGGAGAPGARPNRDVQGRLEPGTPKVDGDLEVDAVRTIMLRGRGQLRSCYNQGLKSNPTLSGLLVVHFAIGPDGKVTAAEVVRPIDSPEVGQCIVARIRRFQFPSPAKGSAHVQQPFNLSPQ